MRSAYTTLAVHRTDVDMAPRSTGRTSRPDKPVKTKVFEQTDDSQHHQEDRQTVKGKYKETVVFYLLLY